MSIESRPFGGVRLTGEDARRFRSQVRYGRAKRGAVEALRRGIAMAEQIAQFGFVRRASVDRSPEGGGPEEGRHAKHESATAESGDAQPTPVSDPISNKGER